MWTLIDTYGLVRTYRARVPGGWIVRTWDGNTAALTTIADANHDWEAPELVELDPKIFARFILLTEVTGEAIFPPNFTGRAVTVNFAEVDYFRHTEEADGAPSKARTLIVIRGEKMFVLQTTEWIRQQMIADTPPP